MPRTRLCSACTMHLPITKGIFVKLQLQAPLPCAVITAGHGNRWKQCRLQRRAASQASSAVLAAHWVWGGGSRLTSRCSLYGAVVGDTMAF